MMIFHSYVNIYQRVIHSSLSFQLLSAKDVVAKDVAPRSESVFGWENDQPWDEIMDCGHIFLHFFCSKIHMT